MIQYLKPSFWQVALRDPTTWLALAVDFVPVIFVFMFGWGAAALVLLYWAENVIIGVATIFRIIASGVVMAGILGGLGTLFLAAFFTLHYGLFCYGHGVFVFSFAEGLDYNPPEPGLSGMMEMVSIVMNYAPGAAFALLLIAIFQGVAAIRDFMPGSSHQAENPMTEMMSPYGRIVVLHIGIFAGAAAMVALGDPMIGVLFLIVLRMAFSVLGRGWRDRDKTKPEAQGPA